MRALGKGRRKTEEGSEGQGRKR
jgi:hypothetical protein